MKIKYEPTYKGYFYINRAILKAMITKYQLSFSQIGATLYFISQVDYDKRHKHYSKLIRDDDVIGVSLGANPSTIYKQRKELIKKQLFIDDNGVTLFPYFFLFKFEYASLFANLSEEQIQDIFENPKKGEERIKILSEKSHSTKPKITDSFNTSSKENVGLSDENIELSDEDCDIDFQEGGEEL